MLPTKAVWNNRVMWKLILTNSLVIGIVIWLAGVSVKEYACLLVEESPLFDEEKSLAFNRIMHSYLVDVSVLAIGIAAVFHFFVVRRMLRPLEQLAAASRKMAKGYYPDPIKVRSRDEIGQLAQDFNKMMVQLKQVDEKRSKFLRDISHELRTPLTNVNGYLEALSSGVLHGNPELFQSLYEESTRMTRLVEQLRELDGWESEQPMHERAQEVSMRSIVEASVGAFQLELDAHHIKCRSDMDVQHVWADPDGIKQVMDNLLKNAIVYDVGGWIDVTGRAVGTDYRVTVTNRGQPIPPEKVDDIFDRFTRLDSSRSRDTGGAGLGLSIVKEIVARHGGDSGLETREAQIHSFWFTIPIQHRSSHAINIDTS